MLCSSQPSREFARAPTRIFVWRQSLRVGARADGTDPYGKSEPLQGTRCGSDRRRVPAAQRGRRQKAPTRRGRRGHARRGRCGLPAGPGVPGVRRRGRLEERIDRGRGFKVALPLLRQEVHLPHRHRPRTLPKAAPRLDLLHQAHAPQRPRRVHSRAVRRHPQDRIRVAAPRARHGIRLPGPDLAARHRLGRRDLHQLHRPLQGLRAGAQARPLPPEAMHLVFRQVKVDKNRCRFSTHVLACWRRRAGRDAHPARLPLKRYFRVRRRAAALPGAPFGPGGPLGFRRPDYERVVRREPASRAPVKAA